MSTMGGPGPGIYKDKIRRNRCIVNGQFDCHLLLNSCFETGYSSSALPDFNACPRFHVYGAGVSVGLVGNWCHPVAAEGELVSSLYHSGSVSGACKKLGKMNQGCSMGKI